MSAAGPADRHRAGRDRETLSRYVELALQANQDGSSCARKITDTFEAGTVRLCSAALLGAIVYLVALTASEHFTDADSVAIRTCAGASDRR
jgi:hypothetical protein